MQTQAEETPKEVIFDENGQTVGAELEPDPVADAAKAAAAGEPEGKYRIGDKTFATADEALTYAQSNIVALETETQVADAYRQGIRDAGVSAAPQNPNVTLEPTPAAPALDTQELYTNPQAFLAKYAAQIKTEINHENNQATNLRAQSDQIWREFCDRHPNLADFRTEVEAFVGQNTPDVRGIIATKGRPASYDFIATKLKSRFEAYSNSLKPKRELPNNSGGASPTARGSSVTPETQPKKALSFSEQVRSIRKRR